MYRFAITPRFFETKIDKLIAIEQKYFPFFEKYDATLNLIPFTGINIGQYLDQTKPDAIIFAGGYRMYTEEIKNFEFEVMKECLKRKLPILAICCGMWTVNVFFNGTLRFNEDHQGFNNDKINITKMIHYIKSNDLIDTGNYKVNSFHSKVIDKMGDNLKIFLTSHDGEIEGIYNFDKKILGVQFHMENKGVDQKLTDQVMNKFLGLIK